MPYCPTCKKEYPLGTTICPECNVSLLENKGAELTPIFSLPNKEVADRFIESLNSQGIEATYEVSLRDDSCRIFVDKTKKTVAMKQFAAFQRMEKQDKSGASVAPAARIVAPAPAAAPAAPAKAEAPKEETAASDGETLFTPKNTAKSAVKAAVEKAAAVKVSDAYEESTKDESPAYETAPAPAVKEVVKEAPAAVAKAVEEVPAAAAKVVEEAAAPIAVTVETEAEAVAEEVSSAVEEAAAAVEAPVAEAVEAVTESVASAEEIVTEAAPVVPEATPVVETIVEEAAPAVEETVEEVAPAVEAVAAPVVETVAEVAAPVIEAVEEVVPAVEEVSSPAAAPEPAVVEEPAPAAEPEEVAAEEADEDDGEEDTAEDDSEDESIPIEFTANAASRAKRSFVSQTYTGVTEEGPSSEADLFEAKKPAPRRPSLYEEMQKNEAAAADTEDEDDSVAFTPKRPLTAYQFEKKRREDLENFAENHNGPILDTRKASDIAAGEAAAEGESENVNLAFSSYEQTYTVPNYEEPDPTPVYQGNAGKIDWSEGSEVDDEDEEDEIDDVEDEIDATEEESYDEIDDETDEDEDEDEEETPSAPIFVETERVEHEEIDDSTIIDEADIHAYAPADEEYVSPVDNATDPIDYSANAVEESAQSDDAFSDFLSNFKKASLSKNRKMTESTNPKSTIASVSVKPVAEPTRVQATAKKPSALASEPAAKPVAEMKPGTNVETLFENPAEGAIVEDIAPDGSYRSTESGDFQPVPSRPTDIQDTKIKVSLDNDIIEEVVADASFNAPHPDIEQSSSFANAEHPGDEAFTAKSAAPKKFDESQYNLDDDSFHGFIPDYSPTDASAEEEVVEETEFDEFKKRVHARREENEAINAQLKAEATRQASLVKDFGKNGKIVFEDTDELDNYAGFVPDYTPNTTNEEEFDFYKPHQVSSYAKYKKNNKGGKAAEPVNVSASFMRVTGDEEVENIFITHVPASAKKSIKPQDIKNTTFLFSMNGKRLAKLFNSWMMLNITQQTVRAFEVDKASDEDNVANKINGIKKLITDNFGELNEVFLDSLVQRYYSKFLDE